MIDSDKWFWNYGLFFQPFRESSSLVVPEKNRNLRRPIMTPPTNPIRNRADGSSSSQWNSFFPGLRRFVAISAACPFLVFQPAILNLLPPGTYGLLRDPGRNRRPGQENLEVIIFFQK